MSEDTLDAMEAALNLFGIVGECIPIYLASTVSEVTGQLSKALTEERALFYARRAQPQLSAKENP